MYGPVARDEAGNLDEARSLSVLKCLDFILKAVGSQKRSLSREVKQSDFSLTKITLATVFLVFLVQGVRLEAGRLARRLV